MAVDKNPGQWEVVAGKPSKVKTKSGQAKNGTSGKGPVGNPAAPVLKVDELVSPLDSRYAFLDPELRAQAKKEALGLPDKPAEKSKPKAAPVKEAPKKKVAAVAKESSKEKAPKSLPDAIKQLNAVEFNQIKETMKARFPVTPRFWLKEMTDYLNHQLNVDIDPTFSGKPRDFPSSLLTSELRGIITSTFSECGSDTLQAFYEEWVLTMPTEINRGNKVVGTKLMLQLLSFHKPSVAVATLPRFKEVLSSMESRVPASLSLLWVMSQAAVKDTSIGIQVWIEAMLPMIGLKNYAPFIGQVASQLTFKAKDVKSTKETVSVNDYFKLFDLVQDSSLPSAVCKDIESFLLNLTRPMTTSFGPKMFSQYLHRVNPEANNDEICGPAFDCLKADPRTFDSWRKEYKSSMPKSAVLLKWAAAHETGFVRNSEEFRATLFHFRSVNNSYSSSTKRPEALKECISGTEELIGSIRRPKKSKLSLSHVNYLLLFALVGLVYYDIGVVAGGNWNNSQVGRAMDRYGVTEKAIRVYQSCQPYVTLVKEKTQPLIDNATLYAIQIKDLIYQKGELYFPGIWAEADKKYQMALVFIKEQANVLAVKSSQYADQGMNYANHYWQMAVAGGAVYWEIAAEKSRNYWQTAVAEGATYWKIAAEKSRDYWQIVSANGADYWHIVSEKGGEYWLVFKQFSGIYVQKISDFSVKVINEERVQQAWKYTYDMYHRAMHAVGLCTH